MKEEIEKLVRQLFQAENDRDSTTASKILADDDEYLPITRGSGQTDRNRDHTLQNIKEGDPDFKRHVDDARIDVRFFLNDQVAIVRTELPTTNQQGVDAIFCNMQVFLRSWRCVAWQVTKKVDKPR